MVKNLGLMFRDVTEKDVENIPADPWDCEKCGHTNTEWVLNLSWTMKKSDQKYIHGDCEKCWKAREEEDKAKKRANQEAERRRTVKVLRERSGVANDIKDVTFDKLKVNEGNAKAVKILKRIEKADRWIYLLGENATGKSWLLGAGINRVLKELGIPAFYMHSGRYFRRLAESIGNEYDDYEAKFLRRFRQAEIIFWDEFMMRKLFRKKSDLWRYEKVYDLIEAAAFDRKRVVFASNADPHFNRAKRNDTPWNNAVERVGKRIVSRLKRNDLYIVRLENEAFF